MDFLSEAEKLWAIEPPETAANELLNSTRSAFGILQGTVPPADP